MKYILYMHRTSERWLTDMEGAELGSEEFGLLLPPGARIHSIVPLVTRSEPVSGYERHKTTEEVLEWAIFVAVPVDADAEFELEEVHP